VRFSFQCCDETSRTATEIQLAINSDELVQQIQTAFAAWLSGAEIDSIRMLQLGLMLGRVGGDNARLQMYCGIA